MMDKTIDSALLNLRKQIIRGKLDGLAHVEALLALRGVPVPRVMPAKRPDAARRGHMRLIVLNALRDGPKTAREISAYVAARRPEISFDDAHKRTAQASTNMRRRGLVEREGRIWRLAP